MRGRNTKIFAAGASNVNSMVVTLSLINETDKSPMEVTDTLSPIEIWISQSQKPTVNDSSADVVYPGKTAPVGGAMTVHKIGRKNICLGYIHHRNVAICVFILLVSIE